MSSTIKPKTAVLIDDDPQSRRTLRILLTDYCPDVEIVGEAENVQTGIKLIRQVHTDAVFLDIQMADGTGFDLLDKFPNPSFQVIFTTAFDEFALKAFRYNAIDYLLKPIDIDELMQAVDKITKGDPPAQYSEQIATLLDASRNGKFEKIAVSSNEGLHFLELKDIVRLEADVNYTTFYLRSAERITVTKTLKNYEQLLPEDTFFRPHQSHIVNVNSVLKVLREDGGYLLMRDGARVPVARSKKEEFLNLLKHKFIQ